MSKNYFDSFDCQLQSDEFASEYEMWLEECHNFNQWCDTMEEEFGHEENPQV